MYQPPISQTQQNIPKSNLPFQGLPFDPSKLDSTMLSEIKDAELRAKKVGGYMMLAGLFLLLLISLFAVYKISPTFLNFLTVFVAYSFLGALVLITRFALLEKIITKFFPYIQEPEDFLKKIKEEKYE